MADEETKEIESPGEPETEEPKEEAAVEATEEAKEEAKEEAVAQVRYSGEELDKMTVKKLREIGKKIPEITGAHAMKKDELLSKIKEVWGIEEEEEVKKSTRDLKSKIAELRKLKEEAREAKDKKRVDIMRKKIKRLKRKTRLA